MTVHWSLPNPDWIKINTDNASNGALSAADGGYMFCTSRDFVKRFYTIPFGFEICFWGQVASYYSCYWNGLEIFLGSAFAWIWFISYCSLIDH